jgi:hypothetical protein
VVKDLLFSRIGNFDQRHFECRVIENCLNDCVHFDLVDKKGGESEVLVEESLACVVAHELRPSAVSLGDLIGIEKTWLEHHRTETE